MTNQIDINNFNKFIDQATKSILCDSECQKKQTAEQLRDKYLNSKANLILANPQYELSKKNYYTYVSGQNGYEELIEKELNEQADHIINEFKNTLKDELSKIKSQLDTYNGILINFKNVEELNHRYKKENLLLFKKLKEETNDILTNERKTYYEDQEIDSLKKYYSYILIVIYTIVVLCFGVFSLTYPSQFNWKFRSVLLLFFIILPYISSWVLGKIIQIIYWLYSLLPKNVYKNI